MPVEIGPEWDPAAHDYGNGSYLPSTSPGREMALVMGLTAVTAFSLAGVGAFFTYGAAAVATSASPLTPVLVGSANCFVDGTALTAVQLEELAALDAVALANPGLAGGLYAAVQQLGLTWGLDTISVDGLIALAAFDVNAGPLPWHYGDFGSYLGWNSGIPGIGGYSGTPGFPDFPARTVHPRHRECYSIRTYDDPPDTICFWEY